ncbi:MAG: hypothetical protein C4329_03215, partial [Chitinophagaceae bacterium]
MKKSVMKYLLLIIMMLFGFGTIVSAQTKKTTHKKAMHKKTIKHTTSKSGTTVLSDSVNHQALNQRKEYHWKDGQVAAPTGNEATGIGQTQAVSRP